jgi:TP901 family phage tail tape measure protein
LSVYLDVLARLDEKSADQAAADAKRFFSEHGRSAGTEFSKQLSDSVAKGDKDVERALSGYQKSFRSLQDMMGNARSEQVKFNEAVEKFGANSVQATREGERLESMHRKLADATAAASNWHSKLDIAVRGSTSGFRDQIFTLQNLTSQLESHSETAGSAMSRLSSIGSQMGLDISAGAVAAVGGIAAIGAAVYEGTSKLYEMGEGWARLGDKITFTTGKAGDEVKSMTNAIGEISTNTAAPIDTIASSYTQLLRLKDLQGATLNDLTHQISDYDQMSKEFGDGDPLNVKTFTRVMQEFNVPASQMSADLNAIYAAAQDGQVPINELLQTLQTAGPTADIAGLNFGQLTNVLAKLDEAGVNVDKSMAALRMAIGNIATDSGNLKKLITFAPDENELQKLKDVIQLIQKYHQEGKDNAADELAIATFGKKAWTDVSDAIFQGKLNVDDLNTSTATGKKTIEDARDSTKKLNDEWEITKNKISEAFKPLSEFTFDKLDQGLKNFNSELDNIIDKVKSGDWWGALNTPVGLGLALPDVPKDQGPPPGSEAEHRGRSGGGTSALPGASSSSASSPDGSSSSSSSKSKKPDIPYGQYSLSSIPAGSFPGEVPVTVPGSAKRAGTGPGSWDVDPQRVFDAQGRATDEGHRLEEARARLLELQADDNAKAQDIQRAKDDIQRQERSYAEAQAKVLDEQQGTWKNASEHVKQFGKNLDQFGTSIDKDFGLSKGLSGFAENLTKFVAGLAFAPVMGALGAVRAAGGGGTGPGGTQGLFGLMSLAANGPSSTIDGGSGSNPAEMTVHTPSVTISGTSGGAPKSISAAAADADAYLAGKGGVGKTGGGTGKFAQGLPGVGVGGGTTAYMGDAALLAHVKANPNGYRENAATDLTKGLGDCSSSIADLVRIIDGESTAGRAQINGSNVFTGNEGQFLMQHGFRPTDKPKPGTFQVGLNSSHTQATLPEGTNWNWGSNGAAAAGGLDGGGAWDPAGGGTGAFTQHYYRPFANVAMPGMPDGYTDPSTWGVSRGGGLSAGPGGKGGSGGALGTPGATGSPVDGSLDPVMTPDGLPKQMTGQGQGFGLSGGGILGAATSGAIGAGSMALNGLAPGAGQAAGIAAQIGMQELSEGITYAGQVAGIAASGLLQTFMPNAPTTGWGAKLLGSVMGAHPVTTNSADQSQQGKKGSQQGDDGRPDPGKDAQGGDTTGTSAPPLKPDDKSQQPGGQGAPGDTVHGSQFNGPVTVNNGPTQDQVAQAGMQATQSSFGLTP